MKLLELVFLLIAYNLVVAMIYSSTTANNPFPTLNTPGITFQEIPDGCGGFTDCIEYIGKVITNAVLGVVYLVLLIADLIIFIGAILIFMVSVQTQSITGMPAWLNLLINAPVAIAIGVIIYKLIRKGDDDA